MRPKKDFVVFRQQQVNEDPEELFRKAELLEEAGDLPSAFVCVLRAAKQGHVLSELSVGNKYAAGEGVVLDSRQAEYWYKRAYHNGLSAGALNLAIDRRNAGRVRSAFIWFRRAVEMGDGNAMLELAQMYLAMKRKAEARTLLESTQRLGREGISEEDQATASLLLQKL